ncbi:MAG: iron-sulfur cluster assembly scaffold protein [Alphaproteobacteria bacterium]|nr:iron-sulfur cluster assembly scaffold protein [Alphaproteobacteria bacterium]
MSDPLYGKPLLRLAADAVGAGRLAEFNAEATAYNPACGDRISVTLGSEAGKITALGHETHACVLTQASASILAANAPGLDEVRLRTLREEVAGMLRGDSGVTPPFENYEVLKPAAMYRNRHICILLPIDAALKALEQG